MGKKSRLKRERKQGAPKADHQAAAEGAGDLRLIDAHVEAFLEGRAEAETALKMMGRDAALVVQRAGQAREDVRLLELAKNLVALRPRVKTNLYELREDALVQRIERAKAEAPNLADGPAVPPQRHAVAVFDPVRVSDALIRSGRPRTKPERVGAGDVAWFELEGDAEASVGLRLGAPPAGQPTHALRLQVASGVVFVGPGAAADGARLGEVRLDPFSTALHEHEARGAFRRVPIGAYEVHAHRGPGGGVMIYLSPVDALPEGPLEPAGLGPLPSAVATA